MRLDRGRAELQLGVHPVLTTLLSQLATAGTALFGRAILDASPTTIGPLVTRWLLWFFCSSQFSCEAFPNHYNLIDGAPRDLCLWSLRA